MRLALVQFEPRKGQIAQNLRTAAEHLRAAEADGADVVLLPETALSGYFLEGGVHEAAVSAPDLAARLAHAAAEAGVTGPLDVALGFYELHAGQVYNSALYVSLEPARRATDAPAPATSSSRLVDIDAMAAEDPALAAAAAAATAARPPARRATDVTGALTATIRHVHRKVFLPSYGVFDEERFVEAGREIRAFDTAHGRLALLICEDAWHGLSGTLAALDGATTVLIPSASPARGMSPDAEGAAALGAERPGNVRAWHALATNMAAEHGVHVAVAMLVGVEGGKAFRGGSVAVGPDGTVLGMAPIGTAGLWTVDLDPSDVARARGRSPLLADLTMRWPHLVGAALPSASRAGPAPALAGIPAVVPGGAGAAKPAPSRPLARAGALSGPEARLALSGALATDWLTDFLRAEVVARRGFSRAVVGLSGGVDSAVTLALAVRALGAEHVIAVRMPYRTSSADSLDHATLVARHFGVTQVETVDISAAVDGLAAALGDTPDPTRLGNVMARVRMTVLFDRSAALGALPLGTGNKTERLFGYFTWHADDSPPVNPLGDLFKSQVWALARHLGVPGTVVDKPASADLIRGQTDEDDFGITYPRADGILSGLLGGLSRPAMAAEGFTPAEVELVAGRVSRTHWKRRLPTVAMLSDTAIGEYYLRPVDY